MATTTTRITQGTLRLLRMIKALEEREQVEIVTDAIIEYAENYHGEELEKFIETAREEE